MSKDGHTWQRVDSLPALRGFFPTDNEPEIKGSNNDGVPEASLDSHLNKQKVSLPTSAEKSEKRALLSRPRGWISAIALVSLVLITSGSFFFTLSKDMESLALNDNRLLIENSSLKEILSSSDQKMIELEGRITKLSDELENVRTLYEDF